MIRLLKRRRALSHPEQALADARDLVSDNRELDAVKLLTEANRVQRDGRIERRLVELRFQAFQRQGWPDLNPEPEEVVEDLFPGELIPEVAHDDLTVEQLRSAIQHHGSLIVRGLIKPENVDRLMGDIDTAFDAFDAEATGEKREDLDNWYVPVALNGVSEKNRSDKRTQGGLYAVESPPVLFDLIEILNEEGVGELAREFLDEPPMILARKVTLRRMPASASGGWHQDGAFMGEHLRALNVWFSLTPCGVDAPSLDVVGRRVDHIVMPGGASAAYAVSDESAREVADGAIVRPIFEPGDALIFDHLCLHRTGNDRGMTEGRYAVETWLMAPSTYGAMSAPVEKGYQPFDQQPLVY